MSIAALAGKFVVSVLLVGYGIGGLLLLSLALVGRFHRWRIKRAERWALTARDGEQDE